MTEQKQVVQEILVSVRVVGVEEDYDVRRWERSLATHIESWRVPKIHRSNPRGPRIEAEVVGGGVHLRETLVGVTIE